MICVIIYIIHYYIGGASDMKIVEKKMNLFDTPNRFMLAHCVSADFTLDAGIAKEFERRYHIKSRLDGSKTEIPACMSLVLEDKRIIHNIVTKKRYFEKPTYMTLNGGIEFLKQNLDVFDPECLLPLAIPKIGCGLDKLEWDKVRIILEENFKDTNRNILVCYL